MRRHGDARPHGVKKIVRFLFEVCRQVLYVLIRVNMVLGITSCFSLVCVSESVNGGKLSTSRKKKAPEVSFGNHPARPFSAGLSVRKVVGESLSQSQCVSHREGIPVKQKV